jgi:hypothetical protein
MTEDDTFTALRRTPFLAVVKLAADKASTVPIVIVDMWANCYHNIFAWSKPTEEWIQIYKSHGWTFDELIEEAAKTKGK